MVIGSIHLIRRENSRLWTLMTRHTHQPSLTFTQLKIAVSRLSCQRLGPKPLWMQSATTLRSWLGVAQPMVPLTCKASSNKGAENPSRWSWWSRRRVATLETRRSNIIITIITTTRTTVMSIFTIAILKTTSMFRDSSEKPMRLLKSPLILSVEKVETGWVEVNQFITITSDMAITTAMTWAMHLYLIQCPRTVPISSTISFMEALKAQAVQSGGADNLEISPQSIYIWEYFAYSKASTYIFCIYLCMYLY